MSYQLKFRGNLTCLDCGSNKFYCPPKGIDDEYHYRCSSYRGKSTKSPRKCSGKPVNAQFLENKVVEAFDGFFNNIKSLSNEIFNTAYNRSELRKEYTALIKDLNDGIYFDDDENYKKLEDIENKLYIAECQEAYHNQDYIGMLKYGHIMISITEKCGLIKFPIPVATFPIHLFTNDIPDKTDYYPFCFVVKFSW